MRILTKEMCEDVIRIKRRLLELKEKGFTHVVIYEDDNKVLQAKGFKCWQGGEMWLNLTDTVGEVCEITV